MTYKELEDQMNKWSVELEGQEKVFLEQATRVNAWDKVLVENGQKVWLNGFVECLLPFYYKSVIYKHFMFYPIVVQVD